MTIATMTEKKPKVKKAATKKAATKEEAAKAVKVPKKPKPPKKAKRKVYIKNKELYAEIVLSLAQDKLTKEAERMLILLAERASLKMKYKNADDRKDCIAYAQLDLFRYWRSFNPIYKNAFAYYTEICKRGFAKGWNALYPKKYRGTMSLNGSADSDGMYSII